MSTLFVTQDEVADLLTVEECIEAVAGALRDLAEDNGIQPLRPVMWLPERVGALGMMPGHLGGIGMMGIKTVTVFPGNEGTELDSHQGSVMLFDDADGSLTAVIDATEITAIRTAAASAVATRELATTNSAVLTILGAGVQGTSHARAIPLVRPISNIRIWSRNRENARRLADSVGGEVFESVAAAMSGADIVCTTTASPTPIVAADLLEPGMHINAVGSSVPFARELDAQAIARSKLFVDRRESTFNESGDFLMAKDEGAIDDTHIVAELGEVLVGDHPGRETDAEITLFKSLGLAVEDIAAAHVIYRNALAKGAGTSIEFGGKRHA